MLQIVWVELLTQKQTNKKQNSPLRRDYYIYQCSVCIALFNRITRFKSKDHVRGNANTEFPLLYINLSVTVAFLSFEINSISFDTIRKGGNTQQTPDYILFFIVWETSSGEKIVIVKSSRRISFGDYGKITNSPFRTRRTLTITDTFLRSVQRCHMS